MLFLYHKFAYRVNKNLKTTPIYFFKLGNLIFCRLITILSTINKVTKIFKKRWSHKHLNKNKI